MSALPPLEPLDPAISALVLIDLQGGIVASPTAPLAATEVVANARRLARACREVGTLVVPGARGELTRPARRAPPARRRRPSVGTRPAGWAEIVPELGPEPGDLVIAKRQWGAFDDTELDLRLRRRGISTLILGGISTDRGVESTARDAYERGYQQLCAIDALGARGSDDHAHSVTRVFPRLGRVRPSEEIVRALRAGFIHPRSLGTALAAARVP